MMAEVDLEQLWKDSAPGASQGEDVDLEKLWADSAPKQTPTWMDVVKSIPGGLAKGMVGFRGLDPESISDIGPSRPEAAAAPTLKEANEGNIENKVNSVVDRYTYKPQTEAGRATQRVSEFVGDPLSYMGPGGPIRKGVLALGAGLGAEAAGQFTKETPAEPYARAIGGMAVPAAANKLAAPFKVPPPEHMKDVNLLRQQGINPTAGDVLGKKSVQRLEEMGDYLGGNDSYTRNKTAAEEQLTRRAAKEMGSDVPRLTPEELIEAEKRIGEKFDRATAGLPIKMTLKLEGSLKAIEDDMMRQGLPEETVRRLKQQFTNVYDAFDLSASGMKGKPGITGKGYQSLTNYESPLSKATRADNADVKLYAIKIRSALDDAAEASANVRGTRAGKGRRLALEELKQARSDWFHYLTLRDIATKGGKAQEGLVTPQNLRAALTSTKAKKEAYALDRSKLAPVARAANNVMTPLKSSGTAERGFGQSIKGLFGLPQGLIGRAVNSPAGQRYLQPRQRPYAGPIVSRSVIHALRDSDALSNSSDPLAQ